MRLEKADVVHSYCNRRRSKSALMVFARNQKEGEWVWGEHRLPRVCSYSHLGIDFHVIEFGMCTLIVVGQGINLSARSILLLAVVRPSLEYGNEIWECSKGQANAILLGVLKNFR